MTCVAYDMHTLGPEDTHDSDDSFVFHDLRKALQVALHADSNYAATALVDSGAPVQECAFDAGEPDLGMDWAREKGYLQFTVTLGLHEPGQSEVLAG